MVLTWLIAIPMLGALAALALRHNGRGARAAALGAMVAELVLASWLWWSWGNAAIVPLPGGAWLEVFQHSWIPMIGASFLLAVDGLSLLMVLLTALIGAMSVLSAWRARVRRAGVFYFLLLWMLGAAVGIFLAMDLLLLYVFWEMMIIPLYFLIALWGGSGGPAAATKTFIFTQVSGLFMLVSSIGLVIWSGAGSFDYFSLIGVSAQLPSHIALWLMLGFLAAMAIKLPVVGVHTWLVDAHQQAPINGAVDLSGLVIKVGAYGLIRFLVPLFPDAAADFATVGRVLAVAGILYGGVMAFAQSDLKRLAAYITISHMGFVLLAVFVWNELALQGAVVLIISSALGAAGLFVMAGIVHARTGRRDLANLGGLWRTMPRLGGLSMALAMAAMGLPMLASFVGEILVLAGTLKVSVTFTALAAGGFVISVIYAPWLIQKVFQGKPTVDEDVVTGADDLSRRELAMLAAAVAVLVWLGVYPHSVLDTSAPAVRAIQQAGQPTHLKNAPPGPVRFNLEERP